MTQISEMDNEVDLDSVGEKLYELIYPKHGDMAPKLTGMLLELPGSVVKQMLQDESLLKEALQRALDALGKPPQPKHSDAASLTDDAEPTCDDALGERLYELVELYDTGHAQKITGMLLEQDRRAVMQLLSDPRRLQENVGVALRSLNQRSQEEMEVGSGGVEQEEVEELGERLFTLVQDIDNVHCADITGMLLEMDCRTLKQILSDHTLLKVAVQRAKSALEVTSHQNLQNSTPSHPPSLQ